VTLVEIASLPMRTDSDDPEMCQNISSANVISSFLYTLEKPQEKDFIPTFLEVRIWNCKISGPPVLLNFFIKLVVVMRSLLWQWIKSWASHGQAMGKPWAGNGQAMGWQWTSHGLAMDKPWAGNGQAMGWQWTSCRLSQACRGKNNLVGDKYQGSVAVVKTGVSYSTEV